MSDTMFYGNLTEEEGDEYIGLLRVIRRWEAWNETKPEKRGAPPKEPTDAEFIRKERLAMKGWKMEVEDAGVFD